MHNLVVYLLTLLLIQAPLSIHAHRTQYLASDPTSEPTDELSIEPSTEYSLEPSYTASEPPASQPSEQTLRTYSILTRFSGEVSVVVRDFTTSVVDGFVDGLKTSTGADVVSFLHVYDLFPDDGPIKRSLKQSSVIAIETVSAFYPGNPFVYTEVEFVDLLNSPEVVLLTQRSMASASMDSSFKGRILAANMDSSISVLKATTDPAVSQAPEAESYTITATFVGEQGVAVKDFTPDVVGAFTKGVLTYCGADYVSASKLWIDAPDDDGYKLQRYTPTLVESLVTFISSSAPSVTEVANLLNKYDAVNGILLMMAEAAAEDNVKLVIEAAYIQFSVITQSPSVSPTDSKFLLSGKTKADDVSDGAIAGAVIGSVAGCCVCVGIFYLAQKTYQDRKRYHQELRESQIL